MNTLTGYSKSTLTDSYLLTAAGGHIAASDFATWKGVIATDPSASGVAASNTADFLKKIHTTTKLFNTNFSAFRGSHYWLGNYDFDTGVGNLELGGAAVLNISLNTNDNEYYKSLLFLDYKGDLYSYVSLDSSQPLRWSRYAKSTEIPTKTSQLTNDSGFLTSRGYWADVAVSSTSSKTTTPTFSTATATTSVTTPLVTTSGVLSLNGTTGVYLKYNNSDNSSLVLSNTHFKPFDTSNNKLSLGYTSARWSNVYSYLGNFAGTVTINSAWPNIVCNNNTSGATEANIRFEVGGANKGYTGYKTGYGTFLWNSTASKYVYINDSGYFYTLSYISVGEGNEKNASNPPYVWGVNGSDNFMRTYATSSLSVNYANSAGSATIATSVYTGSCSGDDHAKALKSYFSSYKSSTPRNTLISFYSSAMSNGSLYFGYFLSGYNDTPYGGFYVAHYGTPYYVGISYGTFTQYLLAKITDITKSQVGLSNVQNTAFYKRSTKVNGVDWDMAGTNSNDAFTIYAPTTGGTAGYILKSNKDAAPTWIALSDISAGKLGGYEESKFLRGKSWMPAGTINDHLHGIYATGTNITDVPKYANGNNLTYSTVLAFDAQCGSGYGKVLFYVKSAVLYYRHYWDSKWYDWYLIALKSNIPTKVSQLLNDSGYLTSHQSLENYVTLNSTQTITGAKSFEGNLIIKRSPSSCIWYRNSSNTLWGLLGFSAENTLTMWESDASTSYEIYHKGNLDLVGVNGTTGLIKNGSTVTTTTGLTACPIINGVPYYKELSKSEVTADTYKTYAEKWSSTAMFLLLKIPQFTVNEYGILTNAAYTATPIIRTHYIASNLTWTNDNLSFINVFAIAPGYTLTLPGASIENCGKLIFAKKAYLGSAAYISGYITACNSYGTSASTRSIDLVNSSIFVCMNNGSNYSWVHFYCG